tara:strand:+ start:361 stop:534 length:174 start_codon:yes stop_codon:yes gene_type:complete
VVVLVKVAPVQELEEMVALVVVERTEVAVEQVALEILLQLLPHKEIMAVRVDRIQAT